MYRKKEKKEWGKERFDSHNTLLQNIITLSKQLTHKNEKKEERTNNKKEKEKQKSFNKPHKQHRRNATSSQKMEDHP